MSLYDVDAMPSSAYDVLPTLCTTTHDYAKTLATVRTVPFVPVIIAFPERCATV